MTKQALRPITLITGEMAMLRTPSNTLPYFFSTSPGVHLNDEGNLSEDSLAPVGLIHAFKAKARQTAGPDCG